MKPSVFFVSKPFLWIEFLLLFVGIPGLLVWWQGREDVPFFAILLGMLTLTLVLGWLDPKVSFRLPSERPPLWQGLRPLLPRIALVAVSLPLLTWLFDLFGNYQMELLFGLPRRNLSLWAMVMTFYPLLSVAPQEVMFRSFFMPRYERIFPAPMLLLIVNALIFAWAHVFFLNWIAPLLSLIAGWLLADTWQKTRDFRLVCIEHALYGQLVFTSGIGWFFYTGSTRAIERMTAGLF